MARAAVVERSPSMAVRPVRITDAPLGSIIVSWRHDALDGLGFSTELSAELALTELDLASEPPSADPAATQAGAAYQVAGTLRHVEGAARCEALAMSCRVDILEEADLVGLAVRRGNTLTVDLQWTGFGPDHLPAQPIVHLRVAGQRIRYYGVVEGLEQAGLIGSPFTVDLSSSTTRRFAADTTAVAARGVTTVTTR